MTFLAALVTFDALEETSFAVSGDERGNIRCGGCGMDGDEVVDLKGRCVV